jgi:P27 family predicted phage terminase small subunit
MAGTKGRSGGRNRKPNSLHLLQGTFQRARHTGVDVEAPGGVPAVPQGLSGAALAEWHRIVERLSTLGTLSRVDDLALEHYCRLAADASRLQADADGLSRTWFEKTSVDGAGVEHVEPKLHPVFAQLKGYRMALRMYLTEFGLTSASRTRVKPTGATAGTVDARKARYLDGLPAK